MAMKKIIENICLNFVCIVLISHILYSDNAGVQGRDLGNHFFFNLLKKDTTPAPTTSVPVQDKNPATTESPPQDPANSYLESLMNRDAFLNGAQPSQGNNNGPAVANKPITTKNPTTRPTTTIPITRAITTTTTTTRRPATTAPTSTTTVRGNGNNNIINPDGTVNRDRPSMLNYPSPPADETDDRQAQLNSVNFWLQNLFNRQSFLNTRGRANDPDEEGNPNQLPFPNTAAPPATQTSKPQTQSPTTTTTTTTTTPMQNFNRVGSIVIDANGKIRFLPFPTNEAPTTPPVVEDKPFDNGGSLNGYFKDDTTEYTPYNTYYVPSRGRRAVPSAVFAQGEDADENDSACNDPTQFGACEYYPACFSDVEEACSDRDSYLGGKVNRFCQLTQETIEGTESRLLKSYLSTVQKCLVANLYQVREYPSCDDVTMTLGKSLLVKNVTSCLYLQRQYCDVINDETARPDLARMFEKPTSDTWFMLKLLMNSGDLATLCNGEGPSIYKTDLMYLVRKEDSPYKFPKPPIRSYRP